MDAPHLDSARKLPLHALKFGGVAGLIGAAWSTAEHLLGFYGSAAEIAAFAVPILAIVFGVQRWRDRVLGGVIGFSQAFGAALAIGLAYAVVAGGLAWVQFAMWEPEVRESLVAFQADGMQARGATVEKIREAEIELRRDLTPRTYAGGVLTFRLAVAFVVSLVTALFVRRSVR